MLNAHGSDFYMTCKEGVIELSDGTKLRLRIAIVNAREKGFSPFGRLGVLI